MESVVQLLASETSKSKLRDLEAIISTLCMAWETSWRQGVVNVPSNQQRANKLSTVKQGDQNAPQFQQQQQQCGDGTWQNRGRPHQGKRGGKKNAQQQLQQGVAQELPLSAPQQPPPPSFQFTPQEGYFALMASVPFIPPTPPPPSTSIYAPFNRALNLAHNIGIHSSIKVLKTLEVAKIEKAQDPRPNKRARVTPRSKNRGLEACIAPASVDVVRSALAPDTGKGKSINQDEEVSLGRTDDEEIKEVDPNVHMGRGDFEESTQDFDLFGNDQTSDYTDIIADYSWQVPSADLICAPAHFQTELGLPGVCRNKNNNCCWLACQCEPEFSEWLIDSGASLHCTGDIGDFVEYQELKEKRPLNTINSITHAEGQGTVVLLLNSGEAVRIWPVYYVPGMTCKLLSAGMFMQYSLEMIRNLHSIQMMKDSSPFLTFLPRNEWSNIYVILLMRPQDEDLHGALDTVYALDYEVLHRRLAHPSKDVLQKAWKHLKDFPEIEIPSGEPLCPGCAQGKMVNWPFPVNTKRATRPFELVHSDLKSFPIESYHRFKYVIIFFDDYTSNAWMVKLHTKDGALTATSQFLVLVEMKYNVKVVQWMSDAGGEYKSKVFDKMLKDRY